MENAAGDKGCDIYLRKELEEAGIPIHSIPNLHGEVPTKLVGILRGWHFTRAWYYWVAKGPDLPFEIADKLHELHGNEVRVDGHCGCPSPREWYEPRYRDGVPLYHVDTQEGLNALAHAIRGHWPEN